ncbi:MAG TPA: M14 family metallopeptidase [Symbiobacteriaceae bacterium]|jgi:murein tripeptide amidase MpaA|nr:M14 family metallopeptidase [Symbiobacteriaceae bacterium]
MTDARKVLETYSSSKYHRYDEITAFLKAWAEIYPHLCRLESVGKSAEGREIWSMTITNFATGADTVKPAYHINGQHHAGEVTAAATAVYTIHYLLTEYGTNPAVTELLDTRVVYVLPRLSVDGTEWYFDQPQMLRSTPLMWPSPEEPEGLRPEDINGDGKILLMRIKHPEGEWKVSEKDARLMVRRRPEDREGTFYKIHTEGTIKRRTESGELEPFYDGRPITGDPGGPYARERSFDFNRNYPLNWKPQYRQPGAGRYPFDRPEVRAMAEFWLKHPNIGAAMSYHTRSGMNLRPSPLIGDDKMNSFDLQMYKTIGDTCQRITGYPTVSVYEYFTADYNPDRLDVGSWLEWAYDQMGVQGFEMELWNFPYICGVPYRPFKELKNLSDEKREEEALMQLQWNDRELNGEGFTNWTPFAHPQLGPVEIGGWEPKFVGQNPPEKLLHQEVHKNCLFTVEHALSLPLLRVGDVRVTRLGVGLFKLAVQVVNQGFLPTNVTQVAVNMKATKPVEVTLAGEAKVVGGKAKQELGHVLGRGCGGASMWGNGASPTTEAWAEWVLQATPGTVVTVKVAHDRGGSLSHEIALGG